MAVNTAALKTFAPAMRRQLMEAVGRKLDLLLNNQTPDTLSTYAKQIAELREEDEKSREQLLERVAYTWFNRLCALRYLDAKGWHPFGCKVLMPADDSETQPELLKLMRSGSLPDDLKAFTNEQRLNQLLDGQIPTAIPGGDPQGEVYRELVLAACRSYHQLLPDLFEGLDDASELLPPDDLLTEGSIAGNFRSAISDSDCDDVEIIGWLYQFYISEKKDEVIGKVVKSEDIPAATQLFTPNWIVKYMVQNTIGAQWLATYPDSPLRAQMEFYIEPAEQTDEVKAKLAEITPTSLNPEELTLMDPACGSGHILVEAYEIFKAIYLERGYQLREIPKLILEKNLFGIDIDERAAQLSTLCLLMKGRADDRRFFNRRVMPNVIALQASTDFDAESLYDKSIVEQRCPGFDCINDLSNLFKDAASFGSLISLEDYIAGRLPELKKPLKKETEDLFAQKVLKKTKLLVRQAEFLSSSYDVVIANPPYMGGKGMNVVAKELAKKHYPDAKSDLFACFIERGYSLAKDTGFIAMVTMQSWMYLSSFEAMRKRLLKEKTLCSMAHLGARAFGSISGEIVQTTAFVLRNRQQREHKPVFIPLLNGGEEEKKKNLTNKKIRLDQTKQDDFKSIPGSPIAYSASNNFRLAFINGVPLSDISPARLGMTSSDNARFVRSWFEVSWGKVGLRCPNEKAALITGRKWFPYNKGGDFRKWFGNNTNVINWENSGYEVLEYAAELYGSPTRTIRNKNLFFKPAITWTFVSGSSFGVRTNEEGFIFDVGGSSVFPPDERQWFILGLLASKLSFNFLRAVNPTLNFQAGNVGSIPVIEPPEIELRQIEENAKQITKIVKSDWDGYERSWDFQGPCVLNAKKGSDFDLKTSYSCFIVKNKISIAEMKSLEEENNRLLIDAYNLHDELIPDVPTEQITLTVNPVYRYSFQGSEEEKCARFQSDTMSELLSYAIGCMMGRYSLDHPGLILADSRSNQEEQLAAYEAKIGKSISEIQFKPDADAIIPVLDGEWFEDDIVARTREFLKVTFPESSVAVNLRFIEDSIGKDIRKYFCKDFYKDHLQTYKKRPIYWMVQSPKAGFACLIYLHRYTPDTLLQVLNNYFRPYLQKLEARQEQLERDQNNDALPKREQTAARKEGEKINKVLKECQAWEQDALLPLAQQRIELDLDDGVKVNYLKLQEVLAKIPGLGAKGD